MYLEIAAALTGCFFGAGVMYVRQRKKREQELQKLAGLTEAVLKEQRIEAAASGEETLYAKMENQLVRVQEILQGRSEAAVRSRDEIQKLISKIAHQMRTPLTNVETYLGLLHDEIEEETGSAEMLLKYVDAAEESGKKLYFLVENFIKMSRLEQHIIQIRKEEGDILRTVRNALGQIQDQAERKGIAFDVTLPERAVCMHDPNWIGEAFYNILDNAVKYTMPAGMPSAPDEICAGGYQKRSPYIPSASGIKVDVTADEMFLKIRIRDYGIGIEAGEENQIFRRFYRGRRVTSQEGFGIGLYLAREIVSLHGGFLAVKRMEKGILMEMNLPSGLLEVC